MTCLLSGEKANFAENVNLLYDNAPRHVRGIVLCREVLAALFYIFNYI